MSGTKLNCFEKAEEHCYWFLGAMKPVLVIKSSLMMGLPVNEGWTSNVVTG